MDYVRTLYSACSQLLNILNITDFSLFPPTPRRYGGNTSFCIMSPGRHGGKGERSSALYWIQASPQQCDLG